MAMSHRNTSNPRRVKHPTKSQAKTAWTRAIATGNNTGKKTASRSSKGVKMYPKAANKFLRKLNSK